MHQKCTVSNIIVRGAGGLMALLLGKVKPLVPESPQVSEQKAGPKSYGAHWDMYSCHTFPEPNIAPENRPSQKETNIPTIQISGAMSC